MNISTISAYYVHVAIKHCAARGINTSELLTQSNIHPSILENANIRVSADQFALLSKHTQLAMQDEGVGWYQSPQKLGTMSILVNHMSTAENVHQALKYAQSFYEILDNGIQFQLIDINENECALRINLAQTTTHTWIFEEQFTKLHRIVRWLSNQSINIAHAEFPYPAPKHESEYPLLFGIAATFNMPHAQLIFKRETLKTALARTHKEVHKLRKGIAYNVLKLNLDPKSYSQQVRRELINHLPEAISYQKIAKKMNIHPQTLRRRLLEENHEFRDIKNNLIRDLSIKYLSEDSLSIKQIAYLLGFKETTSFCRAFKKYTGTSPLNYQKNIRIHHQNS